MLKVLTKTINIQHLTNKPILYVLYTSNRNTFFIYQPSFSQVLEMRFVYIKSIRQMTYDYYMRQRLPRCKIELNQLLHKNPQRIKCPNKITVHPFF